MDRLERSPDYNNSVSDGTDRPQTNLAASVEAAQLKSEPLSIGRSECKKWLNGK